MKYRADFVTNSSSSSFIIVFNSKKSYDERFETLVKEGINSKYIGIIGRDIEENRVDRAKVLEAIKKDLNSLATWKYFWSDDSKNRDFEYLNTPEYKNKVKTFVKEELEKAKARLPKRGIYSIVEYGDENEFYGDLEHYIMPDIPFVFWVVNNH